MRQSGSALLPNKLMGIHCMNPSVIAERHEQFGPYEVQDQELVVLH